MYGDYGGSQYDLHQGYGEDTIPLASSGQPPGVAEIPTEPLRGIIGWFSSYLYPITAKNTNKVTTIMRNYFAIQISQMIHMDPISQ
jgi:hypothetical protein